MLALVLSVCFATCEFAVASNINQKYRTWSGGHAGITLNATGELTIYEAKVPDGFSEGFLRHFWITGGTAGHIDNAIVSYYIDGEATPSVQFQVNMASGTGFVGSTSADGSGPEKWGGAGTPNPTAPESVVWGSQWFGKGSGMGGWYNNFAVPFSTSLRATIIAHESSYRAPAPPASECLASQVIKDTDFWGNAVAAGADIKSGINSTGECCHLCSTIDGCNAWTWHPSGVCFPKTGDGGRISSPGNFSGEMPGGVSLRRGVELIEASDNLGPAVEATDPRHCSALCVGQAGCKAFTFTGTDAQGNATGPASADGSGLCQLKRGHSMWSAVPSVPSVTSGCIGSTCFDELPVKDSSMFVLVRGQFGPMPLVVGGVTLPPTARLITQNRRALLQPLDYYDLMNVEEVGVAGATQGAVLSSTLAVVSGNANFMEGCFRLYSPAGQSFADSQVLATGTEDYYNSGYYFIAAQPMHLPETGLTWWEVNTTTNASSPVAYGIYPSGAMKWSVYVPSQKLPGLSPSILQSSDSQGLVGWTRYRTHTVEPLFFADGGRLSWRNGDIEDSGRGKCWHEPGMPQSQWHTGDSQVAGDPHTSFVRSLVFAYVW